MRSLLAAVLLASAGACAQTDVLAYDRVAVVCSDGGACSVDSDTCEALVCDLGDAGVVAACELEAPLVQLGPGCGDAACLCASDSDGSGALLDVAAVVASRDTDASRAATFDPTLLEDVRSEATVVLECGTYRVARIAGSAELHVHVRGHVVLLVESDLTLDSGMQVTLDPDARLDLFVAGNVRVDGAWLLGLGESDAGRVRVYVGGSGTVDLENDSVVSGALYAPRAELVTRGDLDLYGPLFVRRAAPGGALRIDVATAQPISDPQSCRNQI